MIIEFLFIAILSFVLLIYLKGKLGENYNVGSGMNLKNVDKPK